MPPKENIINKNTLKFISSIHFSYQMLIETHKILIPEYLEPVDDNYT